MYTWTRPDFLGNRADQTNEGLLGKKNAQKSRNSRRMSCGGVAAQGQLTRSVNWWKSWNQIQTLKDCLCCHIYCLQLGAPWGKIVGASRAVSNRECWYTLEVLAKDVNGECDVPWRGLPAPGVVCRSWHRQSVPFQGGMTLLLHQSTFRDNFFERINLGSMSGNNAFRKPALFS